MGTIPSLELRALLGTPYRHWAYVEGDDQHLRPKFIDQDRLDWLATVYWRTSLV